MIETRCTTASTPSQAFGSEAASVTSPSTSSAPQAASREARARIADERPHGDVAHTQRMHDVRPDEPGAARHENGHSPVSKFL